jgi:Na+/proline symporter
MAEENPWLLGLGIMSLLVFTVYFSRCTSRVCRVGLGSGILASIFVLLELLDDLQFLILPESFQNAFALLIFSLYGVAILTMIMSRSEFHTRQS